MSTKLKSIGFTIFCLRDCKKLSKKLKFQGLDPWFLHIFYTFCVIFFFKGRGRIGTLTGRNRLFRPDFWQFLNSRVLHLDISNRVQKITLTLFCLFLFVWSVLNTLNDQPCDDEDWKCFFFFFISPRIYKST